MTATSQHVRHACLHRVPRHCLCFFFWLKSASTVLRTCPTSWLFRCGLVVVDRSCGRLPRRCNRHESRAVIVALMSCVSCGSGMEVWAFLMRLLSHYLCARGVAFAVVPLWRAAATKHCFSLCSTEHPFEIQNLSIFHATQRTGPTDASLPSHASVSPLVLQLYRCSVGFPRVAHDFCKPEDPDAPGDGSSFFAVTQQQWRACIRRMSCLLPPLSLDPR